MARVFISHATENNDLATEVQTWLADEGHEVFLDKDRNEGIAPGDRWKEQLYQRLRGADVIICVVTRGYLESTWCFAEIAVAQALGSLLLPLEADAHAHHPLLEGVQFVAYHHQRGDAQERIRKILREIDAVGGAGWPDGRSPFPGLRSFDVDMHRAFFGRRSEVNDLVRLLRSLAERREGKIVVIVGPSGCGKSSLVRAGLVPAMAREPGWVTLAPFVPGVEPVVELSRELANAAPVQGARSTPAEIRKLLAGEDGLLLAVEELLRARGSPPHRRLLIVIDQFEEILTRSDPESRRHFGELIRSAALGSFQLVVTIRSEFLDALLAESFLAAPVSSVTLRTLDANMLPLVIEGPARLAGFEVDSELVARMVADTISGDALPLLAFTLEQLAADLSRGGVLSARRYEQLGGVRGSVRQQADGALADAITAGGGSREDVLDALLQLVTVDEVGQPTRLEIDYDQISAQTRLELDSFVTRRLLTISRRDGVVLLGVAHEAFLTEWPPLAEVIKAAGSALSMRRALEQATAEWENAAFGSSFLWKGGRLAAAVSETGAQLRRVYSASCTESASFGRLSALLRRREVTTRKVEIAPPVRRFLHASIRHQQRRRSLFATVVTAALVVAFTIASIAVQQRRIADGQSVLATARGLAAEAETVRDSNIRSALQLGIAAHRLRPTAESRSGLYESLTSTPLTATLPGHTDAVYAVAFSPDGRSLATASYDHTVGLWDVTDRTRPVRTATLADHSDAVGTVVFSPDGRTLATGSSDKTVKLWDVSDRTDPKRMATLTGHAEAVYAVAFSPDGRSLATGSADKTGGLWDIADPTHPVRTATLTGHANFLGSVAFSPDGRTLATGSYDSTAALWDVGDRARPIRTAILRGHNDAVVAVEFSPDGRTLATGSYDFSAGLWDVGDRARPARTATLRGHIDGVNAVAFSPDGRSLATGSGDGTAALWDVADRKKPARSAILAGHTNFVGGVAFSPDGRTLATGSFDHTAGLWAIADRAVATRLATIAGHAGNVGSLAFHPDGRTVAIANNDGTVGMWDVTARARPIRVATLPGHAGPVLAARFSADGRTLATGSLDKTVVLWDVSDRARPVRVATLTGHKDIVYGVAFSPDGRSLATGSADNTARMWDIADRSRPAHIATFTGHSKPVLAVAFSPDGRSLATGAADNTARMWDIADRSRPAHIATFTGHANFVSAVAFSPDGRALATGSYDNMVGLWDVTDRSRPVRVATVIGHRDAVGGVAFSPDGRTLATSGADNTARVWDVADRANPAQLATVTDHTDPVGAVAFSPDGNTLLTGSNDDTARLWDLRELLALSRDLVRRSCVAAGAGLTREQWDDSAPGVPYRQTC